MEDMEELRRKRPDFAYILLTGANYVDYYTFDDFEDAYEQLKKEVKKYRHAALCCIDFDNRDRTYRAKEAFYSDGERIVFDEFGEVKLHLAFYMTTGKCLNLKEGKEEL